MEHLINSDLLGKTMALSCAFFWAFAVILFKRSGETLPPLALNVYKTIVSTILFLPLFPLFGIPLFPQDADGKDYLLLFLSGFLGITLADSLFFKSLNILGAGLSAIVDCLYSPFIIFFSWIFLSEHPTMMELAGGFCVVSAVLLAGIDTGSGHGKKNQIFLGILLGSFAMLFLSLGVITMKPVLDKSNPLWVTEVRLAAGSVTLLVQALISGDRKQVFHSFAVTRSWKIAFPGTFLGSYISMILWITAFTFTDVTSVAVLNQTSTVMIVILATLFLKEKFTFRRFLAVVLATSGSILVIFN